MTAKADIAKWDKAAKTFDKTSAVGVERRYGKVKQGLFAKAKGKILLVAAGTGKDFAYLPPGQDVVAVDFSRKMLEFAREKISGYDGKLSLCQGDVQQLCMADGVFDTIVTSCTFCSVPDPVKGLRELRRVLKPGGQLLMFEHVRAGNPLIGFMMDVMTPLARIVGPDLNRKTWHNIKLAGFEITREYNVYLDVVKIYEARPAS
ncbi:MAG: methyltransferase domain-containing protein [Nitrospinae bacterium]|nr:methyltransferase domain-containing protein [Nitrospinota bacterium]